MAGFRVALAAVAASVIAGCATLPSYREDALTTADVIRHIKCELRDATWLQPGNEWVQEWIAGLIFTLDVNHNGGLDTDNTWVFPLNQGALFSINLIGGFSGQATRTERITFQEPLAALESDMRPLCLHEDTDRHARLGGKLGIADLLERAGQSKVSAHINPTELAYNLEFVIKKNAGVAPRFSLIPIGKEKTFSGSLRWTGSFTDTQSLKLTLTPRADTCDIALVNGQCPSPVYRVTARPEPPLCRTLNEPKCKVRGDCFWVGEGVRGTCKPKPKPPAVTTLKRAFSPRADVPRGISRADAEKNTNAQTRNVLQSIDDKVQRQNFGN